MASPRSGSPSARPEKYRGTGYWIVQLLCLFFFAVLCLGAGLFLLLAPAEVLSASGEPPERGGGLLISIFGIVFAVVFVRMLRAWRRMSAEQRAVYAWAVMQQHATRTDGHPVNPAAVAGDVMILATAERARRGELSPAEIRALQALRPDVPYPGTIPPVAGDLGSTPV